MMGDSEVEVIGEPNDHLDTLVVDNERKTVTIDEELPFFSEGFHWSTIVRNDPRIMGYVDDTAKGVIDGEVIAEGTIEGINSHPINGDTTIYVSP